MSLHKKLKSKTNNVLNDSRDKKLDEPMLIGDYRVPVPHIVVV